MSDKEVIIAEKVISSDKNVENIVVENKEVEVVDDIASVLVIILQCETKPCDDNIINLKWVFSDPYFTVQVCAVDPPPAPVPLPKTLTLDEYNENYMMRKALTYAAEGPYLPNGQGNPEPKFWWMGLPVIIVKDSSVSNITPEGTTTVDLPDRHIGGMKKRIKTALDKAKSADLFFLCKWNDACDKYTDVPNSNLKWTIQPTATQAIMYTPTTRDYVREALVTATISLSTILNNNIVQGTLLATVFVPNIIDFDIDLATSNTDYAKLNECAPIPTETTTTSNTSYIIWFIIIIILILLVAWVLIQISP